MTATRKAAGGRDRVRLLALALATLAASAAAAAALPAQGATTHAKVLGKTKHTPPPACPKDCKGVGSLTGFQIRADGVRKPFLARENGRIVAWSVNLSKPTKDQRQFFGNLWKTDRYGTDPTARLAVIRHVHRKRYKLLRQSPVVNLSHAYGERLYITLDHPLRLRTGQIVAVTLPTWAPLFAVNIPRSENLWRASQSPKRCITSTSPLSYARNSRPHQKVGSTRTYGCVYHAARLEYWAYYVPK